MLNTWKDQYDIPIFNYYESFNDIKMLLKTPKELNKANIEYLRNKQMLLQDWLAFELDENSTKYTYKRISKLIKYKYKRFVLNSILIGLEMFKIEGITLKTEDIVNAENFTNFKKILNDLKLPYWRNLDEQIKDIKKRIKGLNNDIGILDKELSGNPSVGSYDYMETVLEANKHFGFRINPREYTLYEWAKTIKVLKKANNGGRN